jgi:hypothetical protein
LAQKKKNEIKKKNQPLKKKNKPIPSNVLKHKKKKT